MTVTFFVSPGKDFDELIAAAFAAGVARRGHRCEIVPIQDYPTHVAATDVGCVVGVKTHSKPCFDALRAAGKHAVIFDKGYTRVRGGPLGTLYLRMSVNDFQPHAYLHRPRPADRWLALGIPLRAARVALRKGSVLFAGSSQKYCNWHGLGDANDYAAAVLAEVRKVSKRGLVYRPKPSFKNYRPVPGADYSGPALSFTDELAKVHTVVTFGSNAAFEAAVRGVPVVVLGDGVARPVAQTKVAALERPFLPEPASLEALAYAVAYCQWTLDEMAEGLAYNAVLEVIHGA